MKRLWVRECFRERRFGKLLVQAIIERARATGYLLMRLDTLAHMSAALRLYRDMGFYDIEAYYTNPLSGALYLEKLLVDAGQSTG